MKVLIASWRKLPSAARLVSEFIAIGADVEALCPWPHPFAAMVGLRRLRRYRPGDPVATLRRALGECGPDLVVACDDVVVDQLLRLRRRLRGQAPQSAALAELLDRSLGPAAAYDISASRADLISVARAEGVLAPVTDTVTSSDDVERWVEYNGTPAFLKLDATMAGEGVRELTDPTEARAAFEALTAAPSLTAVAREAVGQQLFSKLRRRLGVIRPKACIQQAVAGTPANCSFASRDGAVQALVGVEVLRTSRRNGFATHVRLIENEAIAMAATRIARRLNLTGVFGLDFILERASGQPWLIEMNARPTPISHLRLGPGRDLVGHLAGDRKDEARHASYQGATIALFPHGLTPPGRIEGEVVDDLPTGQPELIEFYRRRQKGGRRLRTASGPPFAATAGAEIHGRR